MRVRGSAHLLALTGALLASMVLGVVDANAKDFDPGDVRVCNAISSELRMLTARRAPLRVTRAAIARSR